MQGKRGIRGHGAKGSLSLSVHECTARRGAPGLPPTEQWQGGSQSCQIFCWLCWTQFLFPIFPLFLPSFHSFYFPHARGRGREEQAALLWWPRPPLGHNPTAFPGGPRRWSRDLGISSSRDPSTRGRTLEKENVFALAALRASA